MFLLYYAEAVYFFRDIKNITIMGIAMVAMLAFGGTFAYFTATANGSSKSDLATALIKLTNEEASSITYASKPVLPGESLCDATVELEDGSNRDTYVFAKVSVTFGEQDLLATNGKIGEQQVLDIVLADTWSPVKDTNEKNYVGAYYKTVTQSEIASKSMTFKISVKLNKDLSENNAQGTADDAHQYMNKTVAVKLQFVSIQKDGITAAEGDVDAVETAFKLCNNLWAVSVA